MKKIGLIIGLGVIAYLGSVYVVDSSDDARSQRKLANSQTKDDPISSAAFQVLTENGCGYCHTENSEMPFYANLPIAKQLMKKDVESGLRHFQFDEVLSSFEEGNQISDVALAKISGVLNDNSMPPKAYLSMHWRSNLSNEEKQTLRTWIKQEQKKKHSLASSEFKYEAVQPINADITVDEQKVALGDALYHDKRLSGDNTVACSSCHSLSTGGVDRLTTSTGINGSKGPINAPTVFNSSYNIHQFWDGRANDLQEQAGGPPMNPIEMGSTSWDQITGKLELDEEMKATFAAIYPDGITGDNITDAIAEFEKTLITPNSRFDQFLKGDALALNEQEQHGYELFKQNKCSTCHAGQAMGGQTFEVMGLKADYFGERGNVSEVDNGRFNVTNKAHDMNRFKVPTLRNIALTAPYFHDGSADTLDDAVAAMAQYQVGVTLSKSEVADINAYLKTLTGEYNGEMLN
ncbi:cytochrome-c peroxidase [Aliivibrio sp. EL58]|uniref:cytochrome-c peroxidase n=1 Tax=Aliivibrio sp. EL58 TaxID=2107582 RepID=UPI000EFAE8B1|nr:cytochrome-c peroxidase [Aliivibrio sp. EL58]